jgi:hypothetical protein
MHRLFYILSVIIFISCSKTDQGFSLQGEIVGIKQGKLFLQQIKDSTLVNVDSIIFDGDSKFLFKADVKEPDMLYLYLDRGESKSLDNTLQFFAEPKPMTLKTTLDKFYYDSKFSGSKNHDLLVNFQESLQKYKEKELTLVEWEIRYKKLNNQKKLDSIFQDMHKLMRRQYLYVINFAKNNKNHEIAPFLAVNNLANARTIYLDTIYKSLPKNIASSKYGVILDQMIKERKKNNIE